MQKDTVTVMSFQRIKGRKFNLNQSGEKKLLCRPTDLDTHSVVTAMHNVTAATRYICAVKVDFIVYKILSLISQPVSSYRHKYQVSLFRQIMLCPNSSSSLCDLMLCCLSEPMSHFEI